MKKNVARIMWVILIAFIVSACGNSDSKVNQVIQSQMQEETTKEELSLNEDEAETVISNVMLEEPIIEEKIDEKDYSSSDTVDVDLTKLSSTMVYSEVYNMLYIPENYIGKTVKMSGMFVTYTNQDESQVYPAVLIADATACCSQGLEFLLEGNPAYPEGYPEMKTEITVIGTFETYEEEGNTFCRLENSIIE